MKYNILDPYYFWNELSGSLDNRNDLLDRRNRLFVLLKKLDNASSDDNSKIKQVYVNIIEGYIDRYEKKLQLNTKRQLVSETQKQR